MLLHRTDFRLEVKIIDATNKEREEEDGRNLMMGTLDGGIFIFALGKGGEFRMRGKYEGRKGKTDALLSLSMW